MCNSNGNVTKGDDGEQKEWYWYWYWYGIGTVIAIVRINILL